MFVLNTPILIHSMMRFIMHSLQYSCVILLLSCTSLCWSQDGKDLGVDFGALHQSLKERDDNSLPKQIFLEVNIFEVLVNDTYDIGFVYDVLGEVAEIRGSDPLGNNVIESDLSVLGTSNRDAQLPAGANLGFSVMDGDEGEIRGTIQALAEDQILKVHANPTLLTINSVPVRLESGEEIPYLARKVVGDSETVASAFSNTGIMLTITPEIKFLTTDLMKKNPFIQTTIHAQFSTVSRFREEQGFVQPIIDTRETKTTVELKEKSRVLIGSLFRDRLENRERGIPIIKDIPLLGRLFRSTSNESRISHLFVMIRPVILDIWGDSIDDSTIDRSRSFLDLIDERTEEFGTRNDPILQQFNDIFIKRSSVE